MSEMESEQQHEVLNKQDAEKELDAKVDAKIKQEVVKVVQQEFSGPIPPPTIIKGYEEVLPGSADRILKMAECQSMHRQEMEKRIIATESRDSLLGMIFAFLLGFGSLVAAIVIVVLVPENSGAITSSILGVAGIGSIVATFIKSTRSNSTNKNSESQKKKDDT